jgi:hypothetical protein
MNPLDTIQNLPTNAPSLGGLFGFFRVREMSFGPLGFVELAPIHIVAMVIIVGLLAAIIYVAMSVKDVKDAEEAAYEKHFSLIKQQVNQAPQNQPDPQIIAHKNARWGKVSELIASQNPNDWAMAIIEADSMLDHMLTVLGYPGQSVGEKLQATNALNFPTLEYAWEAHKVRNTIAHKGMNTIQYKDALGAYHCYEKVFTDARYI